MIGVAHELAYSILVADDDRATRDTLREIIIPLGFRTLLATDGAEALATRSSMRRSSTFTCRT